MGDIQKSYEWAVNTCNKSGVQYSQAHRNEQKINGVTYYDCSSFIWYSLIAGGFDVKTAYRKACKFDYTGNAITTPYEIEFLKALGFEEIDKKTDWKKGDILWRTGHTEMVYLGSKGQGRTMGAHNSKYNGDKQVSIYDNMSQSYSWEKLFRYTGNTVTVDKVVASTVPQNVSRETLKPKFFISKRV